MISDGMFFYFYFYFFSGYTPPIWAFLHQRRIGKEILKIVYLKIHRPQRQGLRCIVVKFRITSWMIKFLLVQSKGYPHMYQLPVLPAK